MSDQFISERMIAKIDKVTSSMSEHGFYQFYDSYMQFILNSMLQKYAQTAGAIKGEMDLQSITIEQLRKLIVIVLCLNGIAALLFVVEILAYKWLRWRNCKHSNN